MPRLDILVNVVSEEKVQMGAEGIQRETRENIVPDIFARFSFFAFVILVYCLIIYSGGRTEVMMRSATLAT
jgi:hypothetical protein